MADDLQSVQSSIPNAGGGSNSDVQSVLAIIQGIQNQNSRLGQNPMASQVATTQDMSSATSIPGGSGVQVPPITSVTPRTQAPPWQIAPSAQGRTAQKRADMGALIGNLGNLVKTYAQNKQAKDVRTATNDMNRLLVAIQNGDQTTIQDILGDPKKLKQISKALNVDWLNPSKGSDNVYRKALEAAVKNKQNPNSVQLNDEQKKQLAQQMLSRFPQQNSQDKAKTQLQGQAWSEILKDPANAPSWAWSVAGFDKEALEQQRESFSLKEQEMKDASAKEVADIKANAQMDAAEKKAATDTRISKLNDEIATMRQGQLLKDLKTQGQINALKVAAERAKGVAGSSDIKNRITAANDAQTGAVREAQVYQQNINSINASMSQIIKAGLTTETDKARFSIIDPDTKKTTYLTDDSVKQYNTLLAQKQVVQASLATAQQKIIDSNDEFQKIQDDITGKSAPSKTDTNTSTTTWTPGQ